MRWNPLRPVTLEARLLGVLLPGMLLVLALGLWTTRSDALQAANAAFDRALLGAIKGLDQNVSTASGGLSVEQPYPLFEFFALSASGPVHYRVATDDGLVEIGAPDLPLPAQALAAGQPVFYDARYMDQPVRVGALRRALAPPVGGARHVLIQVAEATESRERFAAAFVRQALARDAAVLAVLVLAVSGASAWALRPVRALAEATRRRAPDDLKALSVADLPGNLVPLVEAINGQVARVSALIETRRQFIDDASHQLRTPLTTLRAQLDYARREADPARAQVALDALSGELDHATRATNQLLSLARADAGALQADSVDLRTLARDVALALLPQARAAGIDFGLDASEAPVPARGDAVLLREALVNLAHNALVHGRGPVTIEAAAWPGGGWRLGVVDAGPGLPPALAGRAGERFAKGRGSRGAGLGLAMARAVAERHGGRLTLAPGDGGQGLRASLCWEPA